MERENKNLLLYFVELGARKGILKDRVAEEKEKLFEILSEVEKILTSTNNNQLNIKLENMVNDVIELTQHQYFEYGKIANTIEEEYQLNYNPFERKVD